MQDAATSSETLVSDPEQDPVAARPGPGDRGSRSLSIAALIFVAMAAVMGWGASFVGLHEYGMQSMAGFTYWSAWLVPATFDGAAFACTLMTYRSSINGRSAVRGRILMWAFTGVSSWINWIHQPSQEAQIVAAGLPIAAVAVFDVVLLELRADYEAKHGMRGFRLRPGLLVLRWLVDRRSTSDAFRKQVIDIPVEEIAGLGTLAPPGTRRANALQAAARAEREQRANARANAEVPAPQEESASAPAERPEPATASAETGAERPTPEPSGPEQLTPEPSAAELAAIEPPPAEPRPEATEQPTAEQAPEREPAADPERTKTAPEDAAPVTSAKTGGGEPEESTVRLDLAQVETATAAPAEAREEAAERPASGAATDAEEADGEPAHPAEAEVSDATGTAADPEPAGSDESDSERTLTLPPVPDHPMSDRDKRSAARHDYRLSIEAEQPVKPAELARRYGLSESWGRRQINAVRKSLAQEEAQSASTLVGAGKN
ncbi:DUF2637 domain-containing protein [Saccharopolyspora sp. MS10]|uniref:DUF2637 domain-containing protein n=1 Tax=Saccharopolyspora sp. MS10 TaxID=3385973 RepID=UPI0039A235BB